MIGKNMPSKKKVLVLEDDESRIHWLKHNFDELIDITWHTCVKEFVVAFLFGDWDLVIFDYDLTPDFATPKLDEKTGLWLIHNIQIEQTVRFDYDKDDLNGLDAAKMIPHASINDTWEQKFLIWSFNSNGAPLIEMALKNNGYKNIIREKFDFYTRDTLKRKIEQLLRE